MLRRFAFPCYDTEAGGGSVADVVESPDTAADEGGSLADHEAEHAPSLRSTRRAEPPAETPAPEPEPDDEPAPAARERDETGKFTKQPKHRAKSHEATPADVPRIAALTKQLRDAEARAERAEAAERRAVVDRRATERPTEDRRREEPVAVPAAPAFPKVDQWFAQHPDKDFDDYLDARAEWYYNQRRGTERAEEAQAVAARALSETIDTYRQQLPEVVKQHPDFDEVVDAAPRVSLVIERAVLQAGPRAAYYLATHPEVAAELTQESLYVGPDNHAFHATVAAMKRYLTSLIAEQSAPSSSASRTAAASGSALALVSPNPPKPPNPGRTTALARADEPPDDESSLAAHERAYLPKSRRA